jgi:hypothetical protein
VATGSVLQGVGNPRSDLDLNIVVESDVTQFPIASYARQLLIDTTYFSAAEVQHWAGAIRDHPWPAPIVGKERWARRRAELLNCTRFGCGLTLRARDEWGRWKAEFRAPWLTSAVAQWWRIEAIRRLLAGRWLAHEKPLLAAQRLLDAVLAALESRAAAAGQVQFGPKWLPEKLRALGDDVGLDVLRTWMRMPTMAADGQSYLEGCEAAIAGLGIEEGDDLRAQLFLLPGVEVHRLDDRTLVSRWNQRGIEIRDVALRPPPEPVWDARLACLPPPEVRALFVEDMTWLSIAAPAA